MGGLAAPPATAGHDHEGLLVLQRYKAFTTPQPFLIMGGHGARVSRIWAWPKSLDTEGSGQETAEERAGLVGEELLLDPHETGARAAVGGAAVDHGGVAEDKVARIAGQLDDAEGHAFDGCFAVVHEGGDPVGGGGCLSGERHQPGIQAIEPLPGLAVQGAPLVRGKFAFLLDEQAG
jgi:hypothetical protein